MHKLTMISLMSSFLLSACQDSLDAQRQKALIEQTNRTYGVKEKSATQTNPNAYEICGNDDYPCPVNTQLEENMQEKPPYEST